jgi:RNA polymerase sigma-70 factor, ECF subfamily
MNDHTAILETPTGSEIFWSDDRAFGEGTSLSLGLRNSKTLRPPLDRNLKEHTFCSRQARQDILANSDEDLRCMERLKAGEDLALNELMARWQNPLVHFILRYAGNFEDALDLAQETFVRVFENREHYEPRARFSTWLFTIATNLCRNLSRWRNRHPAVSMHSSGDEDESTLEDTMVAPGDTPSDSAERNDLASAVRRQIQDLPHDLKTVVLLFEYQDLGYEQIASVLGCTPKAVETRLYRARQLLRDRLERWLK